MISFESSSIVFAMQNGEAPAKPGQAVATTQAADAPAGAAPATAPGMDIFWIFIPVMLVMAVFSWMGQRKEKKKREALLSSIGKFDKVQTAGGIIGHVVEVKPDTVTLKVDEASNLRITFAKGYVTEVIEKSSSTA